MILAGGLGSRLSEETSSRPKPMVEIGGRPILWHIMKIFGSFGVSRFLIMAGYKSEVIKDYFQNFALHNENVFFDISTGETSIERNNLEPWKVHVLETGDDSDTGGRLLQAAPYLDVNSPFFMTYGDGVADVDLNALLEFHLSHGRKATLTAAQTPARFGALEFGIESQITEFREKPQGDGTWVNAGFFVLHPETLSLISGPETSWEHDPLSKLAESSQLMAFKHTGFWQPMDTLRDKYYLENLWRSGSVPWKTWES